MVNNPKAIQAPTSGASMSAADATPAGSGPDRASTMRPNRTGSTKSATASAILASASSRGEADLGCEHIEHAQIEADEGHRRVRSENPPLRFGALKFVRPRELPRPRPDPRFSPIGSLLSAQVMQARAQNIRAGTPQPTFRRRVRALPYRGGGGEEGPPGRPSAGAGGCACLRGPRLTFTRPRRSSGLTLAVTVVRSMASRAETSLMLGGCGRLSDIRSENWPWVSASGRNASSKRRASARAARCTCRQRQVSRTRHVKAWDNRPRFDMR